VKRFPLGFWRLVYDLIRRGIGRLRGKRYTFPVKDLHRAYREDTEPWDL
jgi:hypothetical protein